MSGLLEQALQESGYGVTVASNGRQGLGLVEQHDLVILDIMMPVMNGYEMVRQMRAQCLKTPVLMVTARDSVDDRVKGLDLGADDYLIKPFKLTELLARVRALLRRIESSDEWIEMGDLTVDTRTHKVRRGNANIYLSNTEYSLLMVLLKYRDRAVSKQTILREVWDDESGVRDFNVVEVYIKYLRGKLEMMGRSRLIHTVRGLGYMISAHDSDA
jgi:DNA-binding response OmpR family regulator